MGRWQNKPKPVVLSLRIGIFFPFKQCLISSSDSCNGDFFYYKLYLRNSFDLAGSGYLNFRYFWFGLRSARFKVKAVHISCSINQVSTVVYWTNSWRILFFFFHNFFDWCSKIFRFLAFTANTSKVKRKTTLRPIKQINQFAEHYSW